MQASLPPIHAALKLPRRLKQTAMLGFDLVAGMVAFFLAIHYHQQPWPAEAVPMPWVYGLGSTLALGIFAAFGLYRAVFRHTSLSNVLTTTKAVTVYALALFAALVVLPGEVPLILALVQPWLLLTFMVGVRSVIRYWLGTDRSGRVPGESRPRLMIYGAGSAGAAAATAIERSHQFTVIGFLDDDEALVGRYINGHPIHSPRDLNGLIARYGATDVLLAMQRISRGRRNEILAALRSHPLHVRTLPPLGMAGRGDDATPIQELDIEDLLGRDPVPPSAALMARYNTGCTVLVTGAGGSIGSELCRQLLALKPKRLLLLEHNEYSLYEIHQSLQSIAQQLSGTQELIPLLGSVCDARRVAEVLSTWQVDIIYHAAAYKHVPMVEHNPAEGIRNNTFGTLVCAIEAARHRVAHFVLISTDKAVRPTNVMGASKRLSEMVLQALAAAPSVQPEVFGLGSANVTLNTRYCMVRFGNVLGSSGSVVPLFRDQIKRGGPVTVTHEEVTRYFMTIPEAAQLVIQAGAMAEDGDVFVLDMGQPIRIVELAGRMIELSGLRVRDQHDPEGDIAIAVTGLRPGEKLYEELLIGNEPKGTEHPRIMKASEAHLPWNLLLKRLKTLDLAVKGNEVQRLRELLLELVSGYQPESEIVDWVHLAACEDQVPSVTRPRAAA